MKPVCATLIAALLLIPVFAQAGVIVGGTRVIYDATKKESSLEVINPDNEPYLIQSWVEAGNEQVGKVPFIITPPLFRLDAGQKNVLRVLKIGEGLAENQESLFWLNIKSIPPAPTQQNTLQLAIKTRIKLIYRPQALKGSVPEMLAARLTWKRIGSQLQVSNPTPYYMNFQSISVAGLGVKDATYVAPNSTASFTLPAGVTTGTVTWKIISDYGAIGDAHSAPL